MAQASIQLVYALRRAADRLDEPGVQYRWSHFAHCNCGHLVQAVTGFEPSEIQKRAMVRPGDWGEQAVASAKTRSWNSPAPHPRPDYGDRPALDEGAWEPENVGVCATTGTPLDEVLDQLYAIGVEPEDVRHLERLSDPDVRKKMGNNTQDFLHYRRGNVVAYMRAWADLLQGKLGDASYALAAE